MAGIILILILAIWFFVVFKLAGFCVSRMAPGASRSMSRLFLGVMIFLAPVADDIAGGFQFRALCDAGDLLIYDEQTIRGKTLVTSDRVQRTIEGTILPIKEYKVSWVDIVTGEVLLEHTRYFSKGGWLSRTIGFPEGNPPYTFNGECSQGAKIDRLAKELNFERKYR